MFVLILFNIVYVMTRCEWIWGQNNEGSTHVEEGAGMLQYELTGVWFILTVIYINVELISLERGEKLGVRSHCHFILTSIGIKLPTLTQVTKQ